MHNETIERVLACRELPSLPGVAARVIELTSDRDVEVRDLASAIQHDQALAAKVLRTINSSYFGLRTKCTTIEQALVMLGLSAVKSLALGFSLVDTVSAKKLDGFDYVAFWRRGLYSGVAARCVARATRAGWGEEAFLGGLLQDIGVIAMYQALGSEYADVVASTKGDHRQLVGRELAAFDAQHPEIGAMLADRWRLPEELVLPIRYHERPTAAPAPAADLVRAIALGGMAHDVLTDEDPGEASREFGAHADWWFGLDSSRSAALLEDVADTAEEVAHLFQLDAGRAPDIGAILERAEARLVEASREPAANAVCLVDGGAREDPVTGLMARAAFDEAVESALEGARSGGRSLVVLLIGLDGSAALRARRGLGSADEAMLDVRDAVVGAHATGTPVIARFAEDVVGVLLTGAGRGEAERLAPAVREALASSRGEADGTCQTVSVGIAPVQAGQGGLFNGANGVEAAAMRALEAARVDGGDCERTFVPRSVARGRLRA